MDLVFERIPSPLGELLVVSAGSALVSLDFEGNEERLETLLQRRLGEAAWTEGEVPPDLHRRLGRYFHGELQALDSIRLCLAGTPFQESVWQALRGVSAGTTTSYGALAEQLGLPLGASRAVGAAVGANPISLVVPCHRVLGTDGSLTGYAGGLDRKRWLLEHEGAAHTGRLRQGSLFE